MLLLAELHLIRDEVRVLAGGRGGEGAGEGKAGCEHLLLRKQGRKQASGNAGEQGTDLHMMCSR